MQVVASAFGDENNFLPHMPMLAGALAGRKKLHIGLNAALLGIQAAVDEMLDEPIGAALERHICGADNVQASLVILSELLRCNDIFRAEAACFCAVRCDVALFQSFVHGACLKPVSKVGWRFEVFMTLRRFVWRIGDDFLKQEVHEQK